MANFTRVIAQLRSQRDHAQQKLQELDAAIRAIEAVSSTGNRRGRKPGPAPKKRGRRRMSAAARRKLSRLLKQRWAQGKMKPRAKSAT